MDLRPSQKSFRTAYRQKPSSRLFFVIVAFRSLRKMPNREEEGSTSSESSTPEQVLSQGLSFDRNLNLFRVMLAKSDRQFEVEREIHIRPLSHVHFILLSFLSQNPRTFFIADNEEFDHTLLGREP